MVLIKGKEYITVAERINMLHKESNNVDILTEILSNDETIVLVKATIKIDDRIYTGHAHEIVGSNEVNQTSAVENAETSAVGRALAFAGIGVNGSVASADEMGKVEKGRTKATVNQINKLKDLLNDDLLNPPEKIRISKLIENDISKESALGILSYYLGRTEFIDGSWQKVTMGILEERRQSVEAA
jgi:hypothetical protein